MASKEATAVKAEEKKGDAAPVYAFEFSLSKDKIGEKTTNPQIKSKVNDSFMGWGAFDECRITGAVGADRVVTVFFARLFGKATPVWEALQKGEKPTIQIYDEAVELRLTDAKPSGGGATSGTSSKPKKEVPKKAGGRGRGRGAPKDGETAAPAKDGEAPKTEGAKKEDGGRGRGRGRGKREDEPKGPSLQRGRANIGGKLGQPSKIQIARAAKAARDKENAARIARGEEPLPDEKKKSERDDDGLPPKKEEKGKAGKKEGGKAEAGKKDAGKKEGGKKEGAKKGK